MATDAEMLALLGQIDAETNAQSASLDDIAADLAALMTRSEVSPELAAAIEATRAKVAAVSARAAGVASAFPPVPVPPTDPIPGSEPLPA